MEKGTIFNGANSWPILQEVASMVGRLHVFFFCFFPGSCYRLPLTVVHANQKSTLAPQAWKA